MHLGEYISKKYKTVVIVFMKKYIGKTNILIELNKIWPKP